jgi:hypothetical protein
MAPIRDFTARLGVFAALCLLPVNGEYKSEIIVRRMFSRLVGLCLLL